MKESNMKPQLNIITSMIVLCFCVHFPVFAATQVSNQTAFDSAISNNSTTALDLLADISLSSTHVADIQNTIGHLSITNGSSINLNGSYNPSLSGSYQLLNAQSGTQLSFDSGSALKVLHFGVLGESALADNSGKIALSGENKSLGIAKNSTAKGGSVYTMDVLSFNDGSYVFSGNQAKSGDAIANSSNSSVSTYAAANDYVESRVNTSASTNSSAMGGAIYAGDVLTFGSGNYTFEQNRAEAGVAVANSSGSHSSADADVDGYAQTYASNTVNANSSGLGGAIYVAYTASFGNGNYSFTGNQAAGGDISANSSDAWASTTGEAYVNASSTINAYTSAQGGAIYTRSDLNLSQGSFIFLNNQASGGNLNANSSGSYANGTSTVGSYLNAYSRGLGGAIFSTSSLTLDDGRYTFSQNIAKGGDAAASSVGATAIAGTDEFAVASATINAYASGLGGAIYTSSGLNLGSGDYVFNGNQAIGGNALANASGAIQIGDSDAGASALTYGSGQGGAIYAKSDVMLSSGSYVFSGNQAIGGGATAIQSADLNSAKAIADADNSGLGGAIYTQGNFSLSGNAQFINNSAIAKSSQDLSSGRGGAVFLDAAGGNKTHLLSTSAGEQIVFSGNIQGAANGGTTANGLYLGNTEAGSGVRTVVLDINAAADSSILMDDSMTSQQDHLLGLSGNEYGGIDLSINKTGEGLWRLGGISQMNSATTVNINQGIFELANNASLNLNHLSNAEFNLSSGATLKAYVPKAGQAWIRAKDVNFANGSQLELTGISALKAGDNYLPDVIVIKGGALQIASGSLSVNQTVESLYSAELLKNNSSGNGDLTVRLQSLNQSFGLNDILDIWRQGSLDSIYRAPLDTMYDTGALSHSQRTELNTLAEQLYGREQLNAIYMARSNSQAFSSQLAKRTGSVIKEIGVNQALLNQPVYVASSGSLAGLYGEAKDGNYVWVSAGQRWDKQKNNSGVYGYDYDPYSLAIGADTHFDRWVGGVAFQYDDGTAKSNNGNQVEIKAKDYLFGLYGGYSADKWYAQGSLQYGQVNNKSTSQFNYLGRNARTFGDFDTDIVGVALEAGLPVDVQSGWKITPYVGLNYAHYSQDGYRESGDANFARQFGSVSYDSVEIPVGVRFAKSFTTKNGMNLTPVFDLSYAANVGDKQADTDARFVASPNLPFQTAGVDTGRYAFNAEFGLKAELSENIGISGMYGVQSRKDYTSQQINLLLWMKF